VSVNEIIDKQNGIYQGRLIHNESLSDYTTWRVGGLAKALYNLLILTILRNLLKIYQKKSRYYGWA